MRPTVIAIAALILQLGLVLWLWRRERGGRASSLSLYAVASLFVYHGGVVFLGAWSDKYRASYFGVGVSDSDAAHMAATAMLAAIVAGHGLTRWKWRGRGDYEAAASSSGPWWFDAAWCSSLAIIAVSATASVGIFNTRAGESYGQAGFTQVVLYYLLYPLLALAAATVAGALGRDGSPWVTRLSLLAAVSVAALSGRRLSMVVVGLTANAALPKRLRHHVSRRFIVVGVIAVLLVAAWTVPFRAFQEEQRGVVVSGEDGGQGSGIGHVLRQYIEFLGKPGQGSFLAAATSDMSGRADGHAFLAQVMTSQAAGGDQLNGACVFGSLLFAVPNVLWPAKTEAGLRYCKSTAVGQYSLPPVDYTPTVLGELTADFGPLGAVLIFFLYGAILERADAWVRRRSFLTRAMVLSTVGQSILVAESSWLGLALSMRTMLMLWSVTWAARYVFMALWGGAPSRVGPFSNLKPHAQPGDEILSAKADAKALARRRK